MFESGIQVWGDSIAVGITYDEQRKRYVISKQRCPKRLSDELQVKIVNNSKMGATVLDGLERFEATPPVEGALCVLEYGGNDCNMDWAYVAEHPEEPTKAKVELPEFSDVRSRASGRADESQSGASRVLRRAGGVYRQG